jgi:micrococcal nuclease
MATMVAGGENVRRHAYVRLMLRRLVTVVLAAGLVVVAGPPLVRRVEGDPGPPAAAVVERVVDGDTIVLRGGERVRYIGMDTPESVKPGTPVQCWAKVASHDNERLVEGERVRLRFDAERRDRYGRMLAYVYRARDGLFVNAELVRRGDARVLTIPPDDEHAALFRHLAARARASRRGLWGAC